VPEVVFFKTHFNHEGGYKSYDDYWRLVDLAGYRTCLIDEIDPQSDNVYIGTPFDNVNHPLDSQLWTQGWLGARARVILYDLEWHMGDNALPLIPGLSEIWAADKWYALQIGARYVPLGSDARLPLTPINRNGQFEYDAVTLSYNVWRRQRAHEDVLAHGLTIAPNAWGVERDQILERSRMMLHVHQHEHAPTVAPQRWAIAAAYRLPMLTETLADEGIFGKSYKMMSDFAHLGEFAAMCAHASNAQALSDYGHTLHGLLCRDFTFKRCVEAAV